MICVLQKEVPPDLEAPRPESPKHDAVQAQNKRSSPFPLKSTHFLPVQNGPLQQPEPSTGVAAVTVPTNPATIPASSQLGSTNQAPLPSSTSPAGGVPFPSSLLSQEEFPTSKTVSPVLGSKVYDSVVKSPRGSNSDVVHSLPYPICSDYTVGYSANQYSKQSYLNQDGNHQKLVTNSYYNHHPQPGVDKYSTPPKDSNSRSNSTKDVVPCDGYNSLDGRFDNKPSNTDLNYCVGQAYPSEKTCDPQAICKKSSASVYNFKSSDSVIEKYPNPKETFPRSSSKDVAAACETYSAENLLDGRYDNKGVSTNLSYSYAKEKTCDPQGVCKKSSANVYNFKTNELLTQQHSAAASDNLVKNPNDKAGGKITGDCYPKTKVPNRTTYYQSIVNKSHSRHKSSRRVLPASAYENSKQVLNNYSVTKPELQQGHPNKPVQYSSHHYTSENKKHEYYQPLSSGTTSTTSTYNCNTYKSDSLQTHSSSNVGHSNYPIESQTVGSRGYKNNSDYYRDKQALNSVPNASANKSYSYHQSSKGFVDTNASKLSADNTTPAYGNNDYYQKGNVNYSRTGSHQSAISDNYKTSNHSSEHSAYQNKSGSYHSSRTSSDKSGRTYYPIPSEGSYKSYQQDLVPKQSAEEPHGYRISNDRSSYLNYGSSNSLKSKETVPSSSETSKHIPHDSRIQNTSSSLEPTNPSVHPPVSDSSSVYQSNSTRDKPTFYPYAEAPHYSHQRTPPTTKPSTAFEPITPSKNTEAFGLLSSSTAISSYPPKPPASSPVTVSDPSRNSVKTLWSPTITAATLTNTTNREIIAASSRDSHSSHSNSSISSLSQLSQSLGSATQGNTPVQSSKELQREGRSSSSNGHSRSSSGNETPICSATPVTSAPSTSANSSSASYGISGSLTSLIFSKPSWTSPSVTSVLTNPGSHFTPPASGRLCSPVPSVLPLGPSLPSSHSFAANHPAGGLHSSGPHVMFAPPPLPPAGSLSSPSLPLASASPFGGDSLFAPPPPSQDLLNIRRELDTRFLASQDRSINVPPPPYLRAEMHQHQHQHTHMHQHSPFLPPPLGGSLLPPSAAHLYDKFPKVDSSFYGRNALGLPTYPISPLLAPGSATATPTPFAPPGHMAAFQPKISPLVKAKTMKSGRWCAMHVRISWEIYHHQQQKQQAENQKSGGGPTKTVTDLLRPPNHLFGSIPRPHELGFSSPLLGAAASLHARSPYDVSPQHPSFLGPTPAHLGITPYARPNYPSMGVPGNSFGGLGTLGLPAASMLGGRELGPSFLGMGQDPWSRLHRTPPNFPSPSAINATSWGGLKAEAERDRIQKREDQEREKEKEKQKRAEQEKREKENEKSKEIARESKKEHEREKQKERDRENRMVHVVNTNSEIVRNGEVTERNRDKEWERSRERRETSRSPIRTHKSDGGFEGTSSNNNGSSGSSSHVKSSDIKVKEEKKEDEIQHSRDISVADRERTKPIDPDPVSDYISRGMLPMGLPGAMSHVPPSHFWNPLPPGSAAERYRQNLELHHAREMDREQLMQKYASLSSVMPLLPERYSQAEQLARHLASSDREVERQLQADRDRQVYDRTKLPPPPLRPNDPPYVPPPGLPQTTALFPSLPNPFLNSLCTPGYPPRTKPSSPGGGINNGVPPPLIPCASPVTASTTPSPLHLKMGTTTNSSMENSREHYASKERRDLPGHSIGEVESQSR